MISQGVSYRSCSAASDQDVDERVVLLMQGSSMDSSIKVFR